MPHASNWFAGWTMILAAFAVGAGLGLRFHETDFFGGYESFRRRLVRLGHIALAALGLMNVVFGISPIVGHVPDAAGSLLIAGGVLMPLVCFLTAWKAPLRQLFVFPVALLLTAIVLILLHPIRR